MGIGEYGRVLQGPVSYCRVSCKLSVDLGSVDKRCIYDPSRAECKGPREENEQRDTPPTRVSWAPRRTAFRSKPERSKDSFNMCLPALRLLCSAMVSHGNERDIGSVL